MAERTYGILARERLRSLSGLEFLSGTLAGDLPEPPFGEVADVHPVSVETGTVTFEATPAERFLNPMGTVHGGWISLVLDTVMGCAVHSILERGRGYTTLELKVQFLRPVARDAGRLLATGRLVSGGRSVAFAEGDLRDAAGTVLATATTTCALFGGGPREGA